MIPDDANASPLQPDGLANPPDATTDRNERLASTQPDAIVADGGDGGSAGNALEESQDSPRIAPQVAPQPSPRLCGICGQSHWELYAHLPIETDAYLAAVANLNRRSKSDKRKRSKPSVTLEAQKTGKNTDSFTVEDPSQDVSSQSDQPVADQREKTVVETVSSSGELDTANPREECDDPSGKPELEADQGVDEPDPRPNLADFPHGTAWRCYDCEALSLVWPIESEPIAETVEQPARRRSSPEFRDGIKTQIECCLRAKATDSRSAVTLKNLRVLDLNLGRGTRADRNLALLHELGLAKHQIFGIGDDTNTIDNLNFAGYQAYYGTIDHVLGELPDDYFHLVLGFNVIEYLPNPSATIERLTAKLRPDARFLLELSNPAGWQARLFRHGYWASYQRDRRILLSEKALRVLGQRCNFAIETIKAYSEPQAWETSSATWTRRKRHPLSVAMRNGWVRGTLVGLDRLRAALGMASSRYGVVLVLNKSYPPIAPDSIDET